MDPMDHEAYGGHNDDYEKPYVTAGDVISIRSPGSPANNAGRQERLNQGRQNPNTDAPGSNIVRIYG